MEKIKVTMDGQVYEVDKFSAITEFVHAHMQENKQKYVLAFCNRKLCELGKLLDRDVELKLVEKTSVIGMDTDASIKRFVTSLPERYKLADGNCMLNGCIFEVNDENCRVMEINRIIRK